MKASASNKVVLNTGVIYAKTIITIAISLYSTRLLINALGAGDFGLFNVIGGLITMLAFLNAAMTVSTQRFISYNIGTGELSKAKKIFANSAVIHFFIGIILVLLFEIVGLYLLNYQLKIEPSRLAAANMVFQFVVVSTFITVISVPYDAIINAHENMTFLAVVGIIESLLKLFIAFYLFYGSHDRLLIYGFLMMLCAILIRVIKRIYVRNKYKESHVNYITECSKPILKELTSFAGWNLFGTVSYISRNQGLSVLLNMFFGTIVNAAYGIASQVAGQLNFFSAAMLQALNPQIMKSEGSMERNRMLQLSMVACKFGYMLLAFIAIPCIAEMSSILSMWLKNVPEYTSVFCSLILISVMLNQLTSGLDSAIQATGNIRNYMLVGGLVKLLVLPCAYVLLKLNMEVYYVFIVYALFEGGGGVIRLYILSKQTDFSIKDYFNKVILPVFPVTLIVASVNVLMVLFWNYKFRWLFSIPFSVIIFLILAYLISLNEKERVGIKTLIQRIRMAVKSKFKGLAY